MEPGNAPEALSAPFDVTVGLKYVDVTPDGVSAELTVHPALLQPMGIVHGGVWCSVVESLASVSAYTWLSANGGGNVVGVNNNTDFLRAVTEGTVRAASEPVHRGRLQQLWLVSIRDDRQRLIARGQVRLQNLPAAG
ncbi:MAG: PaaI family thioesterase [Mycobacterium sp.]